METATETSRDGVHYYFGYLVAVRGILPRDKEPVVKQ
jgi:hypothetical protein